MHELGLCASIVDAIEQRAGDRAVARVRIRVGRLHHVHPEAFDQSFAVAAMGSVAEDARPSWCSCPYLCAARRAARRREGDELPLGLHGVLGRRPRDHRRRRADPGVDRVPRAAAAWTGRGRHVPRHPRPGGGAVGASTSTWRASTSTASGGPSTSVCWRTRASQCGDWVLIHVGFAMSKIDEEEARLALASLQMLGEVYTDEVEALFTAPSAAGPAPRGEPA